MGTSQRIRTEIGINKTINIELEQDFNFIEILSLKIQQEEIYTKSCSEYGVVIGRITANNGFGIPNAKLSIFIPISDTDKFNPNITAIYPYTSPEIRNEDGYRYNLLPYEKSYTNHVPTGTFPSRLDATIDSTAIEIYDKYYKFTVKTNDSGDYMIMGVPLGVHLVFMDLDLSDIGEFSLSPQDLIRMGRATEKQVSGPQFKSSSDLNSLPQIVSLSKSIDISPLWGDPNICQIAINRVDFDLRDDANIDIQPTAVFMGSVVSSVDTKPMKVLCKPPTEMGNMCSLVAGPGQILCIRQTIFQDTNGRPILEQYNFDGGNDVIETDGSWLVDLPMNLDYMIMNEFGEKIISNDPKVGIPTKSKYRFKVKWKQSNDLGTPIKRGYFLVPNIRENGWANSNTDPRLLGFTNPVLYEEFIKSYAFSLDWADYGNTGTTIGKKIIQSAIDCDDRFYQFSYNKVYTISQLIDLYHKGTNRGRFIGIKQITDTACDSTNYKFPTNDGVRNFDIIFNIVNFFLVLNMINFYQLIPILHILAFIWPLFKAIFAIVYGSILWTIYILCRVVDAIPGVNPHCKKPPSFKELFNKIGDPFKKIAIPMITYPECEMCNCKSETIDANQTDAMQFAIRAQQSQSLSCTIDTQSANGFSNITDEQYCADDPFLAMAPVATPPTICEQIVARCGDENPVIEELLAGNGANKYWKRTPASLLGTCGGSAYQWHSQDLTLSERLNLFNTKGKYFNNLVGGGWNQIKVSINPSLNPGKFHNDNVMALLIDEGCSETFTPGAIISFNGGLFSKDVNLTGATTTNYKNVDGEVIGTNAVVGTPISNGLTSITVGYASPFDSSGNTLLTTQYIVNQSGATNDILIPNTEGQITLFGYEAFGTGATNGTYNNIVGTTTSVGVNASFNIVVVGGVVTSVNLSNAGYGYSVDDTIRILGTQIGGTDLLDDINITITGVTLQAYRQGVIQKFPTDIEYFQVITATTYGNFCNLNPVVPVGQYNNSGVTEFNSLRYRFTDNFMTMFTEALRNGLQFVYNTAWNTYRPIYTMPDQKQFVVAFLVRGVDPNSARQPMTIDVSRLFGRAYNSLIVSGDYKLNIPIQPGLVLPRHNQITTNQTLSVNRPIFFDSYIYNVPQTFSSYTTNLIANYSSLDMTITTGATFQVDSTNSNTRLDTTKIRTISVGGGQSYLATNGQINVFAAPGYFVYNYSTINAGAYELSNSPSHYLNLFAPANNKQHRGYYDNEYIEGGSYFYMTPHVDNSHINGVYPYNLIINYRIIENDFVYFSPAYSTGTTTTFIQGTQKVVMRTDRLPTSTTRDDVQGNNTFMLHQNNGFSVFSYNDDGTVSISYPENSVGYTSGDNVEDEPSQFEAQFANTFTCEGLVPLKCYSGYGESFGVKPVGNDCYHIPSIVRKGCYIFVDKPILRLLRDFQQLGEWKSRFKVNLAACRGLFGHTFVNNWINGTLYAFPIKNKRLFTPGTNKPFNKYCKDVVMLHPVTNNFFYRSSPYNASSNKFIGMTPNNSTHRNKLQLLFPTTIMDLGPRDEFAYELTLSENYYGYNMDKMSQTTYKDISNILNLFVISRQVSSSFIAQLFGAGDASVNTFFSRKNARFDGDYSQAISVNSEIGVDEFDFETYDYSTGSTGNNTFYVGKKTIGIFFSSETQTRDYVSPRRIIRNDLTYPGIFDNLPIFTQYVPMYKWDIDQGTSTIFGGEKNEWGTSGTDIQKFKYQSLDRLNPTSNYFMGQVNIPLFQKGFIFNVKPAVPPATGYDFEGDRVAGHTLLNSTNVTVGAPFFFYFGLVRGNNALDKFNVKYLGIETI